LLASYPVLRFGSYGDPALLDREPLTQANPVGDEDPFTRSQAGFVFGGPIKNEKSYFFTAFEHQAVNASKESHFAVPMVSQRGLFEYGATGLLLIGITNPIGVYPTSVLGDAVFSLYPWPNNPLGPYGYNTRTEILPADAAGSILSLKMDHQLKAFGKDHTLSGRYNFSNDNTILPVTGEALFSPIRSKVRTQNLSLFFDSTLSNMASNQIRVSYGRTTLNLDDFPKGLAGENSITFIDEKDRKFLLNAPIIYNLTNGRRPDDTTYRSYTSLRREGFRRLPTVNGTEAITGPIGQVILSGFSPLGVDVFNFPQQRTNNTFQYADTLIYKFAKTHRITTGFDIRRSQLNSSLDRNSRSQMVFSGAPNLNQVNGQTIPILSVSQHTNDFYSGPDFAAVGAPTGFFQTLVARDGFGTIGLRFWQTDFFLADQIHICTNFALNVGLRYSLNSVPTEVRHRIEDSFASEEVKAFIAEEKQESQNAGKPAISGLEQFLDMRTRIYQRDSNNLAPYLGFAWDLSHSGKTSIRGGIGLYYDQIPGAVISLSRNVFPSFLTLNLGGYRRDPMEPKELFTLGATNPSCSTEDRVNQPTLPLCFTVPGTINTYDVNGAGGADIVDFMINTAKMTNFASGPAFVLPSNNLVTPYSWHWGLNLEREIKGSLLLSLAYVGTQSKHLLRFSTPNLGPNVIPKLLMVRQSPRGSNPLFMGTTIPPGTEVNIAEGKSSLKTNGRPFPLLGSYTSIESDADSFYNSFQFQLNKRFSRGVQFTTAYTWAHAIDEVSDLFDLAGARSLPQNSFNLRAERGSANFDVRHRLAYSFIWDTPVFKRSKLLGGWQVSGIGTLQTGQPFTILAPFDINLDGNFTDRLNDTTGFQETSDNEQIFEFSEPLSHLAELGKDGAVGRNTFRAPGIATINLATTKRFRFTENQNLEFRAELFNLFNRTHFGIPVHQVGFPGLGRSVNTIVSSRMIQFALKYNF
jgi:hypothetical protein